MEVGFGAANLVLVETEPDKSGGEVVDDTPPIFIELNRAYCGTLIEHLNWQTLGIGSSAGGFTRSGRTDLACAGSTN